MKGAREAWVFIVPPARVRGRRDRAGVHRRSTAVAGLAVTGLAVGGLLRTWLVQLSKTQLQRLYQPLCQSLADADGLNAYLQGAGRRPPCRGTQVAAPQDTRRT